MSAFGRKPEEVGKRPEPGALDLKWTYLGPYGHSEYTFDMYQADGSDNLYFVDPRQDPQPWELRDGCDDLALDKQRMTELRDTLTYLLDNWGKRETRDSHPEEEK